MGLHTSYESPEQVKMKEYYDYAQAAQQAQNMTQSYGTVKNTRRKTDWFGLAVAAVVAIIVIVVLITR